MSHTTTHAAEFEPEFISLMKQVFENMVAFNKVIGLNIDHIAPDKVQAHILMKPELVGHFVAKRLHGGVISTALDAMGGLAVMAAMAARHLDEVPITRMQRFSHLGTIDLRVDYLRPATGEKFWMEAEVLRLGSRVASTRMLFMGAEAKLLASGAAAYVVS